MSDFLPTGIQLTYLVAASLFILGLKKLGSPASARNGNLVAAVGMLLAIIATLLDQKVLNYEMILVGLAIGSVIGTVIAYKVQMTEMPQMVGLLNGLGGASSALIAVAEFWRLLDSSQPIPLDVNISMLLDVLIGGVTLTGSFLAFAKLQGLVSGTPITFPLQQPVNLFLLGSYLAGSAYLIITPDSLPVFLGVVAVSLVLGVMFVLPIGGGDMPVVISLLNSLSGVAAAAAGFVVMNNMLIIAGALVGASGLILTEIMCKAMNRSLFSVLFSAFGSVSTSTAGAAAGASDQPVRSIDAEEGAMMLGYARSVVIVPGYGMAVAQAQHS
ncbi:MAG: NAD(P)(+) transhydrogenase (Re/Si-specific) subunit beta, partial [Dolichospermum sp.]